MKTENLNELIKNYNEALKDGNIQKAYRGIMTFMSGLKTYLEDQQPNFVTSALYFGYMDMTYFAFTSPELKNKKLKIAIVYLHEENCFEIWLGGANRSIQAQYHKSLRDKRLGKYQLAVLKPGVDAIIEHKIIEMPDFDHVDDLMKSIEMASLEFTKDMEIILKGL